MRMNLDALVERCLKKPPRRIAVAAAGDAPVLRAVAEACRKGIAQPVLCGDAEKIENAARSCGVDISAFETVETDGDLAAVSAAVSLVREGRAELLMKGLVQTADLLRAVLNKETGLRGEGLISHVAAVDCEPLGRTILLTDCAVCAYPNLKTKARIISNAVAVAGALGIERPRVAALAAVETVNPNMPATLDAAELVRMNRSGQITGCVVDGPLALDGAISPEAAGHKGIRSETAGQADILLFHNIEAGNAAYKALTAIAGFRAGGVVMGAAAPIVMTSRADSASTKLLSIALACASVPD